MGSIVLKEKVYDKIFPLNIGKYEFVIARKDNKLCYLVLNNEQYELPNLDLTLKGNANTPLSNLNSRILITHIIDILQEDKDDEDILLKRLFRIQKIVQKPDLYEFIKGSVEELNNFDMEVKRMIERFDEYNNEVTSIIKVDDVPKYEIRNDKEDGIADTFIIVLIANIGILLFMLVILNIIR